MCLAPTVEAGGTVTAASGESFPQLALAAGTTDVGVLYVAKSSAPEVRFAPADTTGTLSGTPFRVATLSSTSGINPALATDGAGGYVGCWSDSGVHCAAIDLASGTATAGFSAGSGTYLPAVAYGPEGFVVVWASGGSVRGQQLDASAQAVGTSFSVSSSATQAAIAGDANGYVVALTAGNSIGAVLLDGSLSPTTPAGGFASSASPGLYLTTALAGGVPGALWQNHSTSSYDIDFAVAGGSTATLTQSGYDLSLAPGPDYFAAAWVTPQTNIEFQTLGLGGNLLGSPQPVAAPGYWDSAALARVSDGFILAFTRYSASANNFTSLSLVHLGCP